MRVTEENADWICNDMNPAKPNWYGAIWHEGACEENGVITCPNCGETWKAKKRRATLTKGPSHG